MAFKQEESALMASRNGVVVKFDAEKGKILCENWDSFFCSYGTTCLLFDLYYGHKKEKGIESFDKYFEQNGLKEGLLSADAKQNSEAFLNVVYKLFDSAHDAVKLSHSVSDGEVNLTYFHTLNQNYCSEWYHVDTNLDGKFDARDGFGGQYDFYILTSGYSFSCANAMPFLAQADGLAKIIGEQPGGGDCMVTNFLDAYGHVARMSGYNKFGRMIDGKFVSDEHAVKVDYPFGDQADKLYFNYKAIAEWLSKK